MAAGPSVNVVRSDAPDLDAEVPSSVPATMMASLAITRASDRATHVRGPGTEARPRRLCAAAYSRSYVLLPAMCSQQLGGRFSPAQHRSRVELQHVTATRVRRRQFGPIADARRRRLPSHHRGDRAHVAKPRGITCSRSRRPRRETSWTPARPPSRSQMSAPASAARRRSIMCCVREAGPENAWSGPLQHMMGSST
jgi:hypothetical protein